MYINHTFADFRHQLWQRFTNHVLSDSYRALTYLTLAALACCAIPLYIMIIHIPPGIARPSTYQGTKAAPVDTLHKKKPIPRVQMGPRGIIVHSNGHTFSWNDSINEWQIVK